MFFTSEKTLVILLLFFTTHENIDMITLRKQCLFYIKFNKYPLF